MPDQPVSPAAQHVSWFERDPGGGTIYVAPEAGLEYCTVCDELTEIAMRDGDHRVCYDCADAADRADDADD